MKLYPVSKEDLVKAPKNPHNKDVHIELLKFINSDHECCKVDDDFYNNNNDLRRAIQSLIEANNMPIHVFMKYGEVYVEKEVR